MKDRRSYGILPYAGLPILMAGLWLAKRDGLSAPVLLLREVLLAFGYAASLGDLWEKRVPNALLGMMLGAWVLVIMPQLFWQTERALVLLVSGIIGFMLGGILFLTVYLVSRKGLGGGDVKLMAVSGLYLGADGVLPAMLYGSVLSALAAILLILCKKIERKDTIPLVPFLYAGMLVTVFIQ